jgi:hypothetical protein
LRLIYIQYTFGGAREGDVPHQGIGQNGGVIENMLKAKALGGARSTKVFLSLDHCSRYVAYGSMAGYNHTR